jgi:hypothetical protein
LLGIWAVVNTIALRNTLLVVGGLLALFYWFKFLKSLMRNRVANHFSLTQFAPLVLIGLLFCWILFHYFFFAHEPALKLEELKSTWLRSFLAVLLGSATGLALNRNRASAPLLWLGLLFSFLVLLYQYIPKAVASQSMFAVDWFGNYIYWAKFSGVLAGSVLISGLIGMWLDCIWPQFRGSGYFPQQSI